MKPLKIGDIVRIKYHSDYSLSAMFGGYKGTIKQIQEHPGTFPGIETHFVDIINPTPEITVGLHNGGLIHTDTGWWMPECTLELFYPTSNKTIRELLCRNH